MTRATSAAISHARRLRRAPTQAESALWVLLRKKRLEGMRFRRQVPLGPYIVDFMCFRHRLIIEADGPFHDDDSVRDAWLSSQGFRILRFPNDDIVLNGAGVLATILRAVEAPGTMIDQLGIEATARSPFPLAGKGGPEGLG